MAKPASNTMRVVKGDAMRVPPHDLAAEESLLGAMLLSRDALGVGAERCAASMFYKPAHGHIFEAVVGLYQQGEPADPVTVADELKRRGLLDVSGGPAALLSLQVNTPATSNAERYATIVCDNAVRRQLIQTAGELSELGFVEPDVDEALDQAESRVFKLAESRVADTLVAAPALITQFLDDLDVAMAAPNQLVGVPTGLVELDKITLGLQGSTLVTLAARPAMGKTAASLGMAAHIVSEQKRPVLFFSLEMGQNELTHRLVALRSGIDSRKLRTGSIDDRDFTSATRAADEISRWPLVIDHSPEVSVMEMRAKARRVRAQYGDLALVVVDYLQLIKGTGRAETRALEVGEFSRGLKILARDLDVPVLALSQLNRNLEQRAEKRPMLADLKESGSIEQDSDIVMFLYRDEVYNPDSMDRGTAEIIVAKHRSGPIGTVRVAFIDRFMRFANISTR